LKQETTLATIVYTSQAVPTAKPLSLMKDCF